MAKQVVEEKKITRKSSTPLKVYCLPEERLQIEENAKAAGKSVSSFLKEVGQGYKVSGITDHHQVIKLAKVNGDLGRLGGLLKLWLTNDERTAHFNMATIYTLLARIDVAQEKMTKIMELIVLPKTES